MLAFKIWIGFGVLVLNTAQYDSGDASQLAYDESESGSFSSFPETFSDWSYDIFSLVDESNGHPLKALIPFLFDLNGLIDTFNIDQTVLMNFIERMEEGYRLYDPLYHNDVHGADITQTVHGIMWNTGFRGWMTDLEIFATLFAAMTHDYEHMALTNDFLVNTDDERALIYNDISVNENHHVSASFRIVKDDCCNILSNLSTTQYREFRKLVIQLILWTDMDHHAQLLDIVTNSFSTMKPDDQRPIALGLLLHSSDISNPAKSWTSAYRMALLVMEEFFEQGDLERELGLKHKFTSLLSL